MHHQRERRLALRRGPACRPATSIAASAGTWPVLASARAIMPGMMKMNTGSSFRKAAKMRAAAGLALVRRAQGPLHDVLVGAPVPQADDRRAEQHAQPRVVAVEVPGHPAGLLHRRPGALDAGRDERLPEVEHVGVAAPREARSSRRACCSPKTVSSSGADDEDERLQRLGVGHRAHAAEHRVEPGQHDDRDRADPEGVEDRCRRRCSCISGSSVPNTMPPAKMPTAILVST